MICSPMAVSRPEMMPGGSNVIPAQQHILNALRDHFDRSDERLTVEQIMDMVALDEKTTQNALRVLKRANWIEGVMTAEATYPTLITGVVVGSRSLRCARLQPRPLRGLGDQPRG